MNKTQNLEAMPYIKNKDVLKAVRYARNLKNMSTQKAMYKAAKYYGVDVFEVAKYMDKGEV